jgi:hypothetical protein
LSGNRIDGDGLRDTNSLTIPLNLVDIWWLTWSRELQGLWEKDKATSWATIGSISPMCRILSTFVKKVPSCGPFDIRLSQSMSGWHVSPWLLSSNDMFLVSRIRVS